MNMHVNVVIMDDAGLNITMGVYFTQFRRILLHRQVILLEQVLVVILSTSK